MQHCSFVNEELCFLIQILWAQSRSSILGVLCELDLETAYNHVNWNFLVYVLEQCGFKGKKKKMVVSYLAMQYLRLPKWMFHIQAYNICAIRQLTLSGWDIRRFYFGAEMLLFKCCMFHAIFCSSLFYALWLVSQQFFSK